MTTPEGEKDPLNIVELMRQAEIHKKKWRLPRCHSETSRPGVTDWQELMSERLVKRGHRPGR